MKNQKIFKFQVLFTSLLVAAFVLAALGISGKTVFAQDISLTEVPAQPLVTAVPTQAPENPVVTDTGNAYATFKSVAQGNGATLTAIGIHGPSKNPLGASAEAANVINPDPASAVTLAVPTMKWVFGCSAVSSAMIAGYYDRNGYPNMYTGATAGGVYPLTEPASWGTWSDGYDTYPNNPLIASHKGLDGRTTKGSIDDYWVKYGSSTPDPYITGSWTQHSWGAAIGDYMKTSQSAYYSTDGNTWFFNYNSNTKLQCSAMTSLSSGFGSNTVAQEDGTYGRKLFYQAKGYTVTDCYNQEVDGQYSGGFSLANYKAQIDAKHPVLLNLDGHSIVGVGYVPGSSTIYVHDTWDNSTHTMTWNGSYSGMQLLSVSIVNLKAAAPVTVPTPIAPSGTITTKTPTFTFTRVSSATQYSFSVYKGSSTSPLYTKTIATGSCGSSTANCSSTPSTVLTTGSYTWKVRAYVGGVWKSYSALKSFTYSTASTAFDSEFTSNATGWSVVTGPWEVGSGYLESAGLSGYNSSVVHSNTYSTMTYQAKFYRAGCTDCANFLYINGTPEPHTVNSTYGWYSGYRFQYSDDGYIAIYRYDAGAATAVLPWTTISGINLGWNTLLITYYPSSGYFTWKINGVQKVTGNLTSYKSGKVGMGFYSDGTSGDGLFVDWAKLALTAPSAAPSGTGEGGIFVSDSGIAAGMTSGNPDKSK